MYDKAYLWYISESDVDHTNKEYNDGPHHIVGVSRLAQGHYYQSCNYQQKSRSIDDCNRLSRVIQSSNFEFPDQASQCQSNGMQDELVAYCHTDKHGEEDGLVTSFLKEILQNTLILQ